MKNRITMRKLICISTGLLFNPLIAYGSLVAVSYNGDFYHIDPVTGGSVVTTSSSFSQLNSLAQSSNGTLYSVSGNELVAVNGSNGSLSLVANLAISNIRGLAFDASDNLLIVKNGVDYYEGGGNSGNLIYGNDELYRYDIFANELVHIGQMNLNNIQGLDFSSSGTLYGWDVIYGLVTIDALTAEVIDVAPDIDGNYDIQTIAFDENGQLYGAYNNNIYSININTGAYNLVSSGAFTDIRGMEFSVVPVPAAVWLFGSGLLGLAGFARRK